MASSFIEYKGYRGSVHYNEEDEIFFGKVMFINALVSYEGTDAKSIKENFHQAVEDYLALCAETGKEPDRPFKGSFNVRTRPELHKRAALYADRHSTKLNTVVEEALESFLNQRESKEEGCLI